MLNLLTKPLLIICILAGVTSTTHAGSVTPIPPSTLGIPYTWTTSLDDSATVQIPPGHVGAWSWDEDTFPETSRGWTHTSAWVKVNLEKPASLTLQLGSTQGVPWPSAEDANRLAGTNLFPSFTLYRGWDVDAGSITNADGTTLDQDHTYNNRGNIAWAEDLTYLDHVDNSQAHQITRTWVLPAGQYTLALGGNSPATLAEGRQGYSALLTTTAPTVSVSHGMVAAVPPSELGIPYTWTTSLDDSATVQIPPGHVGAWSWDEDTFPETSRGWTHTSAWVKVNLEKPASLTLQLGSTQGVPWPSAEDANRLAGTNLFPSFTLYRGWDVDAGSITNADGTTLDQDHTYNNRGNIAWAEDLTYLDHVDNSQAHQITRTWVLPAGQYTLALGGNSPATLAEGRQGYSALLVTHPSGGLSLEHHKDLQAVDSKGISTWTGSMPFAMSGILLNNPEEFHDATPGFKPFTPENFFQLGGQWQVFVQSADTTDKGGTALWMGQNYGNLPFIRDTSASYSDIEWVDEIHRLDHDPSTGHHFTSGDLVLVVARRSLDFAGKRNINEAHELNPEANFELHLIQAGYGVPKAAVVELSQLTRTDDSNPETSELIFDATRMTGGERWQSQRIQINGLRLSDASGWGKASYFERVCIATDGLGRFFRLRMPTQSLGDIPTGEFGALGIMDQDTGSGVDGTTGYELFVQEIIPNQTSSPRIALQKEDEIMVAWPVGGLKLERSDRLDGIWSTVESAISETEGEYRVRLKLTGKGEFFRLR